MSHDTIIRETSSCMDIHAHLRSSSGGKAGVSLMVPPIAPGSLSRAFFTLNNWTVLPLDLRVAEERVAKEAYSLPPLFHQDPADHCSRSREIRYASFS